MNLEQLKSLMGIALSDTSQDVILSLYLGAALEAAKDYANAYDWNSNKPLPDGIQLGILRWVELSQLKKENAGIQSESMAGMTQTFVSTGDTSYFSEVFDMWEKYRFKGLNARPVRSTKSACSSYSAARRRL